MKHLGVFISFLSLCLHLLRLVKVVGASVINVVAESRSHHGKGIEIGVVLPQLACLHAKDGNIKSSAGKKEQRLSEYQQ